MTILKGAAAAGKGVKVICSAANAHEPPPPTYTPVIETDKATVATQAGETTPVNDTIHAGNSQANNELLNGSIGLIYTSQRIPYTCGRAGVG